MTLTLASPLIFSLKPSGSERCPSGKPLHSIHKLSFFPSFLFLIFLQKQQSSLAIIGNQSNYITTPVDSETFKGQVLMLLSPKLSDFPFEKSGEKHLLGDRYLL